MRRYRPGICIFVAVQLVAVFAAGAASEPGFSGDWVEASPQQGPPLSLRLTQDGSQLKVQMSFTGAFSGIFHVATIGNDGIATLVTPQGCSEQFRHAGYNYDHPGENILTFRLSQAPGSEEPILLYTNDTKWNVPCAQHSIGTEHESRQLGRHTQ